MADEKLTITEALAEIRTIDKRLAKKQESVLQVLTRPEGLKDPMTKEGGSESYVLTQRQSIKDLEERVVELRKRIAAANASTELSVNGTTRTIADWLTWRREVAPTHQQFLSRMQQSIQHARKDAANRGANVVSAVAVQQVGELQPHDVIVNVSESEVIEELDELQDTLGQLDGQLSLKNATTKV